MEGHVDGILAIPGNTRTSISVYRTLQEVVNRLWSMFTVNVSL